MKRSTLLVLLPVLSLPVAAQDECATATPVSGGDVVAFDTTTATQSALPWNCAGGGGPDLWYAITSTTGGAITVETCGSSYDTALEAYEGGCVAPTLLTCNDDACGLSSRISFGATVGTTYHFRVGGYAGGSGAGTFVVSEAPPPTPMAVVDTVPGTFVDISTSGTPLGLSDDGEVDVFTGVGNSILPSGVVRVGSNGGLRFGGAGLSLGYTNQPLPSFSAFGGDRALLPFWDDINTSNGTNGEIYHADVNGVFIVQWENAAFFSSSDTVTFQVQVFSGTGPRIAQFLYEDVSSLRADGGGSATIGFQSGDVGGLDDAQWSHNSSGAVSNGTVLTVVRGSGQIGVNYCSANPNSTGATGVMSATGSATVSANDMTLVASDLPPDTWAFFLVGFDQTFIPHPGGSAGNLCLGGMIGRYIGPGEIQNTGSSRQITIPFDNTAVPSPVGFVAIDAGDVLNFQAWHRDSIAGQPTSNFTDGLEVTFD